MVSLKYCELTLTLAIMTSIFGVKYLLLLFLFADSHRGSISYRSEN